MIVNNTAGWVGGGIYLEDAAKVRIVHNTIANNSSTATGASALLPVGIGQPTVPTGAGVVGGVHTAGLAALANLGRPDVRKPVAPEQHHLAQRIIWYDPAGPQQSSGGSLPVIRLTPAVILTGTSRSSTAPLTDLIRVDCGAESGQLRAHKPYRTGRRKLQR